MKVVSVNISKPRTVEWKGKEVTTGIFKEPVTGPIYLGETDVRDDHVIDRRYHGGVDKACYLYGLNHYPFWKAEYPHLKFDHGMFGENITVDMCEESEILIGNKYEVGGATVQVVQPRQPCFKLGIKFGDQGVLKKFIEKSFSGVYFRVLQAGDINVGDEFRLLEADDQDVSVRDFFQLLYRKLEDEHKAELIRAHPAIPEEMRQYLSSR